MNAAACEITPIDWVHPAYVPVWGKRADKLVKLRSSPQHLEAARFWYRDHVADFINDWGVTVNPKNAGTGRPIIMPFLLFPKQREFVDWVIARWRNHENGVLVKSRECGASWMAMAVSCTLCLFWEDISIGFGSAKEEFVDRSGDPDCLFYKGRMFLKYLPREFNGGWDVKRDSAAMRLKFANTGSSITGGAGDNIGVGGRKTIYFVDEYAIIERPKLIETNLSANTDTRIEMSTVRGINNVFAEHARGGVIPRFDFSYRDDPTKTNQGAPYDTTIKDKDGVEQPYHCGTGHFHPGFASHVADMDPVIFNQEYGCDFLASIEGGVIEAVHVQAAIGAAQRLGIMPTGAWTASYDIADLGNDKNALAIRHGVELVHVEDWSGTNSNPMDSIRRAFAIADRFGCLEMIYDASGMGGSWHEYFAIANTERVARKAKPIKMRKFQGGGTVESPESRAPGTDRKNIDYFENLKAQSWMAIRMRFVETFKASKGEKYNPERIISINPGIKLMTKLTTELAQPTRKWSKNGKLMIDKTPDGVASPNIADAVMQAFGSARLPLVFTDEVFDIL